MMCEKCGKRMVRKYIGIYIHPIKMTLCERCEKVLCEKCTKKGSMTLNDGFLCETCLQETETP